MTELRPYQAKFVEDYERAVAEGKRRILGVAPTGASKTVMMRAIIEKTRIARRPVLVLAHRREIITQTSTKLRPDIAHGLIMAGVKDRPLEDVQVAAIQTLWHRAIRTNAMELPAADILVIDECHHCPAETYRKIIDSYPDAVLLGLTATPCRGDGRGLGGIFETFIECPQVAELVNGGYLVRTRVYAPVNPDLKGVRVQAGDYVESQLAERMDRPKLVGDVVAHWHKYSERRKTVCFAVNVGHSVHLRDEFIKSGVRAEHIDGSTPKAERDASLERLASGEIELVTNCAVLTEGWDMPEVGCCILARPTKQMGLYRQMVGRVLRPADGKTDAIILDHSGAVFRHGFAEDHVEWTLGPDRFAANPVHAKRGELGSQSRVLECSQCGVWGRIAGQPCPHCGFLPQAPPKPIVVQDGDLGLVQGGRAKPSEYDRFKWFAMLIGYGNERGYKPGWAAYKFKEKFGTWPPRMMDIAPIAPTAECRSWIRSRQIAYAKAQQKAAS
jgi:superfamily II DNA or RNA helicase